MCREIPHASMQELKAMAAPPPMVKTAMQCVLALLGEKASDWEDVRRRIKKDDFLRAVDEFQPSSMTTRLRSRLKKDFLDPYPDLYERANNASKACGPLVLWVQSQVNYATVLEKIEPLRQELSKWETETAALQSQQEELNSTIEDLEKSIERYKDEYAVLISQTTSLKKEMERVSAKVTRSTALLSSLLSEQTRWNAESEGYITHL